MVSTHEKIKFITLRTIGNFFILFSLFGMLMTFGPAFYFEFLYRFNQARNITYIVSYETPTPSNNTSISATVELTPTKIPTPTIASPNTLFGQLTGGNRVEELSPVSSQFGIVIPKIGANAPVVPNVDAGKPESYLPALQEGVAHALGTVFPGVVGNIYLFAHSTDAFWNVGRYNAVFYLIKELDKSDEIDLFYNGVRHIYRVVDKAIIDPSDISYITKVVPFEQLTLQTCWPPGTTLKRLVVIARPEKDLTIPSAQI